VKSCQNHDDKCGILGIGQQYRPPFAATHQWYESFPEMACGILPQKSDIYIFLFFFVYVIYMLLFLLFFFLNIILLGGARGLLGRQVKRRSSRRLDRHESEGPAIRGWAKKQLSLGDF